MKTGNANHMNNFVELTFEESLCKMSKITLLAKNLCTRFVIDSLTRRIVQDVVLFIVVNANTYH